MAIIRDIKPDQPPNEVLISRLEHMLEDAKAGRMHSFAAVALLDGGESMDVWCCETAPTQLIGCLQLLSREIIDQEIDTRLHKAGCRY